MCFPVLSFHAPLFLKVWLIYGEHRFAPVCAQCILCKWKLNLILTPNRSTRFPDCLPFSVSAGSWSCSSHREVKLWGRERLSSRLYLTLSLCFTGWVRELAIGAVIHILWHCTYCVWTLAEFETLMSTMIYCIFACVFELLLLLLCKRPEQIHARLRALAH